MSARYSRLRRCAISAVTNAKRKPNTSPAVTTWRSLALSWKNTNGSTPFTSPAMLAPTSAPREGEERRDHDVAEDASLELAVAEPRGQPGPQQRQHHEVEQDRRLGERHVPRQLRRDPRDQRGAADHAEQPAPAAVGVEPVVERAHVAALDLGQRGEDALGEGLVAGLEGVEHDGRDCRRSRGLRGGQARRAAAAGDGCRRLATNDRPLAEAAALGRSAGRNEGRSGGTTCRARCARRPSGCGSTRSSPPRRRSRRSADRRRAGRRRRARGPRRSADCRTRAR